MVVSKITCRNSYFMLYYIDITVIQKLSSFNVFLTLFMSIFKIQKLEVIENISYLFWLEGMYNWYKFSFVTILNYLY